MISVSSLPMYIYCPRKMYLQYVHEIRPLETVKIIIGNIKHGAFEAINRSEKTIVKEITPENKDKIEMLYKQKYYKTLAQHIRREEHVLEKAGIDKVKLLEELWNRISFEAEKRAEYIQGLTKQKDAYGEKLWEGIELKQLSEVTITSRKLKLRGRIDRVEIEKEKYTPIEIKTGRSPKNSIWEGDEAQLGAYILLLKQKHKSEYGYVEYTEQTRRIKLEMNDQLKEKIINLTGEAHELVKAGKVPRKCENKNKCLNCNIRKECRKITMDYDFGEEKEEY